MLDILHIDLSPVVLHIGPESASVIQPLTVDASFNSSIGWNGKNMSSTSDTAHFSPRKTPFRDGIKPHRQGRPAHNDMPGTAKSQKHNNASRSCEGPAATPTANTGLAFKRLRKTRQFAHSLTELRQRVNDSVLPTPRRKIVSLAA
jgi:hypothetical protein